MKKTIATLLASASMLAAPLYARAAEATPKDDRYTIVWRESPAGRGQTNRLPFRVLMEEYRQGAPCALTGKAPSKLRVVYKDVPAGRGQTQRLPFIVQD